MLSGSLSTKESINVSGFQVETFNSDIEYVEHLVYERGLTHLEAYAKADEIFNSENFYGQVKRYSKDIDKGLVNIEFGLVARVSEGSYPTFVEILDTYSVASGDGKYTWNASYTPVADIQNYGGRVQLLCSGYLTLEYNTSLNFNEEFEIDDLINLGYSVSSETATTTYLRTKLSFDHIFNQWYA